MSRVGLKTISIPSEVFITVNQDTVLVKGAKDEMSFKFLPYTKVIFENNELKVSRSSEIKQAKSNHGTLRAIINNAVTGVVTPWKKDLEIRGTGYKSSVNGNKLTIIAGFIHPVIIDIPQGITATVAEDTKISISGANRELVGQIASTIRKVKPPEPYKGKGIRYTNEVIKLKAGKTAKA